MRRGLWAGLAGALILVGLGACTPSELATSSLPSASQPSAETACTPIDLRSPSGADVALTGIWQGNNVGLYYIQRDGSCVWWLGQSQTPLASPGADWSWVMTGTLHPDFTITGVGGDVPVGRSVVLKHGPFSAEVKFGDSHGVEQVYLSGLDGDSDWRAVPADTVPASETIDGVFGGAADTNCAWLQTTDGTRYQLGGLGMAPYHFRTVPISLQDYLGHVLVAEGAPIRVTGSVVPVFDWGCADTFILISAFGAAS